MVKKQITRNNRTFRYEITVSQSGKFVSIFPMRSKKPLWGMLFSTNASLEEIKGWVLSKVEPKKHSHAKI